MPANFAALEDRLSAAVDAVFGESFRFIPMRQPTPNSRREADPGRAERTVIGVFDDRNPGSSSFARLGNTKGGVASSGGAPQFTSSNPMLFLDEVQMGGTRIERLDRFRRIDTGDVYEVTDITKDGQGRRKLVLAKVGKDLA